MSRLMLAVAALSSSLVLAAESPRALEARGFSEYEAKQYKECSATFASALAIASDDRQRENFAYSAACCDALGGNADAAFKHLDVAAKAGFRDAAHLLKDADLASLHADKRWAPLVADVKARADKYLASVNAELKALFDADQDDRRPDNMDWSQVSKRDAERRAKVEAIVKAGGAKAADDWFHAAMVFQHGQTAEEIARAHEFAANALKADANHGRAKWLFAASKDRLLMRQKKPQLYGTQFHKVDGKWALYEVDPKVTDEERAQYNVPPIEQARAQAISMNAREAPKPAVAPAAAPAKK